MTDAEKREVRAALNSITDAIRQIERQTDREILHHASWAIVGNREVVSFFGCNNICYELPYQTFKSIPQKRVIIEVTRALTIDFNDYGMEA